MSKNKWNKYLPLVRYKNLSEMVLATIKSNKNRTAMRWFNRTNGLVQSITYEELGTIIKLVFYGLKHLGFNKDDHIAICSETSPEWVFADLGIQALGGVSVSIYPTLKPKEILYILKDSESIAIFVDNQENLEKVLSITNELDYLNYIVVVQPIEASLREKSNKIISFEELLNFGAEYHDKDPMLFGSTISQTNEDDLASLIYTSGTTGVPKGVMLTHKNFLSDSVMSVSVAMTLKKGIKPWLHDFLALMPYAHSFGRCVGEYCPLLVGAKIDIVSGYNPQMIRQAFEEFKPTIMCGIPYLYQKLYNIILDEVSKYPKIVANLVNKVIANGRVYFENKRLGKKNKFSVSLRHKMLGKVVGKKIKKKLGGRWELMISGSAAISLELLSFFNTLGINLIEGYGLTETSPVTHLLRTDFNSDFRPNFRKKIDVYRKAGTVGPPIEIPNNVYENIEQKLDSITGELLLKGPMVMKGYWKKPEFTTEAIDKEGWFHTGDIAEIDDDGYVKIKDRCKVIIKLGTGKMISPAAVESLITPTSKIIAQFMLVGDDSRNYLTAIVVPYQESLKKFARERSVKYETWMDLIYNKEVQNRIKEEINVLTKDVAEFSRPKKFLISCAAFTTERYITPTYKFKRKAVFEDLKNEIDKLYACEDDFYICADRLTEFYDQSMIIT